MGKDKLEHTAKKRVREETELLKRSDAPGNPGGFRNLFEDIGGDFENPKDSKKRKTR